MLDIKENTTQESLHPWFGIYDLALKANEQWDNSNLKAMEKIADRVPWLSTGFDSNDKYYLQI